MPKIKSHGITSDTVHLKSRGGHEFHIWNSSLLPVAYFLLRGFSSSADSHIRRPRPRFFIVPAFQPANPKNFPSREKYDKILLQKSYELIY
jgi:hypothetical protein